MKLIEETRLQFAKSIKSMKVFGIVSKKIFTTPVINTRNDVKTSWSSDVWHKTVRRMARRMCTVMKAIGSPVKY